MENKNNLFANLLTNDEISASVPCSEGLMFFKILYYIL